MKKSIVISFIILSVSVFSFAQSQKTVAPVQFTKAELLGLSDLKAILTAINKGQDYSKYIVRNFNLTTTVTNTNNGTTATLSEMGPGGAWSEKQKAMIEAYAKKGVLFTLDNIVMMEKDKKGIVNQPGVSFMIKE
jgi:hypothetical protein